MYLLEYRDMAGFWHLRGEYNTFEEAESARQEYFYSCLKGDYPYCANIVNLNELTR